MWSAALRSGLRCSVSIRHSRPSAHLTSSRTKAHTPSATTCMWHLELPMATRRRSHIRRPLQLSCSSLLCHHGALLWVAFFGYGSCGSIFGRGSIFVVAAFLPALSHESVLLAPSNIRQVGVQEPQPFTVTALPLSPKELHCHVRCAEGKSDTEPLEHCDERVWGWCRASGGR